MSHHYLIIGIHRFTICQELRPKIKLNLLNHDDTLASRNLFLGCEKSHTKTWA